MLVYVHYAYFNKKSQKVLLLLFTLNQEPITLIGSCLNKVAVKVFLYSFSEAIPIFFNRFKSDFILV